MARSAGLSCDIRRELAYPAENDDEDDGGEQKMQVHHSPGVTVLTPASPQVNETAQPEAAKPAPACESQNCYVADATLSAAVASDEEQTGGDQDTTMQDAAVSKPAATSKEIPASP